MRTATTPTPYRLVIFANGTRPVRRGRTITQQPCQYAFMGWTADQTAEPHRLPGSGTFLYAGLHVARAAAFAYLAQPETAQVSVRTNQDRRVYRYIKHADGRIAGYADAQE